MDTIIPFAKISLSDIPQVGGKNASLGEMMKHLTDSGIKVPDGFATTADAYRFFLKQNQLDQKISQALTALNHDDIADLKKTSREIRQWILEAPLDKNFQQDISEAYQKLSGSQDMTFAVRSSATAEDLPEASFAGQQETFLNVSGEERILAAVKKVFASLFTERAISYRQHQNIPHMDVAISVGVQHMIRSDLASSGVIFTLDTESGFNKVIFITASYGLGEAIVQGTVNPDEFYVYKPNITTEKTAILSRRLGSKTVKMIYNENMDDDQFTRTVDVPEMDCIRFCLRDEEINHLSKQALLIEQHYNRPMDIEWAKDGIDGEIYILQARPETVKSRQHETEHFSFLEKGEVITTGRSIGQKIGQGKARVILDPKKKGALQPGEVLVTDMTDPDWEPIMKIASGIVTNRGGRTCHAAIIARELGIPAVVGCENATLAIKDGDPVTISCVEGETGFVYKGHLQYESVKVVVDSMPKLPLNLMINLGSPEKAFDCQFLPNEGVGLARLEFIISNSIGIHPNAVLQMNLLLPEIQKEVLNKTASYSSPVEFYIEKLREGISTISAAFHPKPVIFRFSDFKSNEYSNLLGGDFFEPKEENPMIGFRGASRYVDPHFQPCFELECQAFKRVINDMGLENTHVMIPFVRTVDELQKTINLLEQYGLKRNGNFKIYMMCEVPSNALLAEEFLHYIDGYSIGSNDLTQLTLGLDRDSQRVASLFDERDSAVKVLFEQAINACNKLGKYIGICGQAPSDYPELAQWLVSKGIQSLSLNPDTIIKTWLYLGEKSNEK
jgi:pyruvate,water dikinase